MKKHKRIAIIIGAVSFVAIIAITTSLWLKQVEAQVAKKTEPPVGAAVPSHFAFSGATGWWQGATRDNDIALFAKDGSGCFVSAQYYANGTSADAEAKMRSDYDGITKQGYTYMPSAVQAMMIQTNTGKLSYNLQQQTVTTPTGATQVMGGVEHGYIPLAKGYIYVMGNCNQSSQLVETVPALQAIRFDASKVVVHKK